MDIETKRYIDGSSATGPKPLPDLSPEQQAGFVASLTCPDDAIRAYGYLVRLLEVCAPHNLMGICTQIDNLVAGYRSGAIAMDAERSGPERSGT